MSPINLQAPFRATRALATVALAVGCLLSGRVRGETYSFSTFAGTANQFGLADGTGVNARFGRPTGVAVDSAGNVYVSEDAAIRKITPAGEVTTIGGGAAFGYVDGDAAAARFRFPTGLAVDAQGNVFVADAGNNAIRRITPAGRVSTIFRTDSSDLDQPSGIALDGSGNVYVADTGNARIRKISPGGEVTTLAGNRRGTADGTGAGAGFQAPRSLAFDAQGTLYVADYPGTVRKITAAGVVTTLAGTPGNWSSADGIGADVRLAGVVGIAVRADGSLLVTESSSSTLRLVSPDGRVTTIAGQPGQHQFADGIGGHARFRAPAGIAIDPQGNIFVADSEAPVIRKGVPVESPAPPVIFRPTGVDVRNAGSNTRVAFDVVATGESVAVQWAKNGLPIAGATGPALELPSVTRGDEGTYTARVSNAGGTVISNPFSLTVFTPRLTSFASRRAVPGGSFLWGIAAGADQLVAVGTGGTILGSSDGRTWVRRSSGTSEWLVAATYGGGKFVAVGDHGTILLSTDGLAWRPARDSGTKQRLNNVVFAQRFVAVGEGGSIVTSEDGETWVRRNSGVTTWLRGLVFKPFVRREVPQLPPYATAVVVSGTNESNLFYATGENGVILTSSTGLEWSQQPFVFSLLSPPARSAGKDMETLAEGPVGVGADGTVFSQSTSLIGGGAPLIGKSMLSGNSVTYVYEAYTSWSRYDIGINARFRGLVRGAGAYFATGEQGAIAAASAASGPWAPIASGTSANLVNGVFRGDTLFIVGEDETILESDPMFVSRLTNLSTRGAVGPGAPALVSGLVVSGAAPKQVLLRAAGPALAEFGVTGALATPTLAILDAAGRTVATNTRWGTAANAAEIAAAAARIGAFPFAVGSADSALLVTLAPGSYTAQAMAQGNAAGITLVEAYDADALANEGSRAINISTQGVVDAGDAKLIAGFVLTGADERRVLIRAVGPGLRQFGATGVLAQPKLELFDVRANLRRETTAGWSAAADTTELRAAMSAAGAFPLEEESSDAAFVMTLLPGPYTVQVSGLDNTRGRALVEVYQLP